MAQLTRSELHDLNQQRIADDYGKQNTAQRVREVVDALIESVPNRADDGLPTPGAGASSFGALTGQPDDNAALQARLRGIETRGPNLRPSGDKQVRVLSTSDPRWDAGNGGEPTLYGLDTTLCHLGEEVGVEFVGKYVLVYDGDPTRPGGLSGGRQTYRDGSMRPGITPLVPCKWVAIDSPSAQVKDYTEHPADYNFPAGTYVGAYVTGQTTEQFFKRRTPGGTAPAPVDGGDATYWELVSAADVPIVTGYQATATLAESDFVNLYQNGGLGLYDAKLLRVPLTGGTQAVRVRINGSGSIEDQDAYLEDTANPDVQAVAVSVSVVAGRVVTQPRQAGAISTAWQAGGAPYVAGQLVHNSLGQQFRTKQANASHATEPTLPLSSGLAAYYAFIGWDETRVAATEAGLLTRFNMRGAWAANTLYQQYDVVSYNGATYYRAGAAFTTSTSFVAGNWTGMGAGLYTTIDYLNEVTPADGALLPGAGGRSYVLNGVDVQLFDSSGQAAGAPFYGRLFALRAVGSSASNVGTLNGTIDGVTSLALQPGEWLVLKSDYAAGGYTKVMRGTVNAPSGGSGGSGSPALLPSATPNTYTGRCAPQTYIAYNTPGVGGYTTGEQPGRLLSPTNATNGTGSYFPILSDLASGTRSSVGLLLTTSAASIRTPGEYCQRYAVWHADLGSLDNRGATLTLTIKQVSDNSTVATRVFTQATSGPDVPAGGVSYREPNTTVFAPAYGEYYLLIEKTGPATMALARVDAH